MNEKLNRQIGACVSGWQQQSEVALLVNQSLLNQYHKHTGDCPCFDHQQQ